MTPEERDRLIEAAEELKNQRTAETCLRTVVMFRGKEWAPGRFMKSRYFIVNVPKGWNDISNMYDRAQNYISSQHRFPLFHELSVNGKYEPTCVTAILVDSFTDTMEIT